MKIGILGGRFDPPHIGHWLIALQTLEAYPNLDKLLLIPARQHQWKPTVASGEERLEMLSFFKHPQMDVSDIELSRSGISYSIDTIKEVKKDTKADIYWIVGADILPEFQRWDRREELIKEATWLIFPRDPHELPKQIPEGFKVIDTTNLAKTNISSTLIRERLKHKKSIHGFVLPEVEEYIKDKKLYE